MKKAPKTVVVDETVQWIRRVSIYHGIINILKYLKCPKALFFGEKIIPAVWV